jgi:hypothetical protein
VIPPWVWIYSPIEGVRNTLVEDLKRMRGGLLSKEVADRFVEALWKLEEDKDVEALVEIHAEDCDVGNVAVPRTFSGHAALEWNTSGEANGKNVSYHGVSLLEMEEGKNADKRPTGAS